MAANQQMNSHIHVQPGQPVMYSAPGSAPVHPMYNTQPQQGKAEMWMQAPAASAGCPPGLEYLTMVDQLLVHQQIELLEAFIGFETNNKYAIKNTMGQQVYFAVEDTDCCTRQMCGNLRPFEMKVLDNMQREVIHLHRPLACESCCCPCWLQEIEVTGPPGSLLGMVRQEWSFCTPKFRVENAKGETMFRIQGPICPISCCGDVDFQVLSPDGLTEVGKISKQWSGLAKEMFTDADNFGIQFPPNIGVDAKATLMGALFLIDFIYFQKANHGWLN